MKEPTPLGLSVRTAAIMMAFTLVFTALMAGTYQATKPAIEQSAAEARLRLINEVLPPASYDNKLLADALKLGPTAELGLRDGGEILRARKDGQVVAVVLEAVAPDGYAGAIKLILSVDAAGRIGGVRVTEHRETPGLGDYIDPLKDKNKAQPWVGQFKGREAAAAARLKLRKDGGDIDYMSGATISPRAVTNAVRRAQEYVQAHRAELFKE